MNLSRKTREGAQVSSRRDRLLPWIAAERAFRALVLVSIGIVLVTHPHANWATEITNLAQHLGLDPKNDWIQRAVHAVSKIHVSQDVFFGAVALAYGVLEAVESYGLFRHRRWGEYLTVVATSLLFIPELWELTKSVSLLKVGALVVNALVVAYLVRQLRTKGASKTS